MGNRGAALVVKGVKFDPAVIDANFDSYNATVAAGKEQLSLSK